MSDLMVCSQLLAGKIFTASIQWSALFFLWVPIQVKWFVSWSYHGKITYMQKCPIFFGYHVLLELKFCQAKSLGLEWLARMELPYY